MTQTALTKIFVTDIEGNNLYHGITKFHCSWIHNIVTDEWFGFRPDQLEDYCAMLSEGDVIIGHNIVDFDMPALKKLNKVLQTKAVFDTLVLSRMLEPDRLGGHSLDSWGRELDELKGDFGGKQEDWETFSEEMYTYCKQDVNLTSKLYKHLCQRAGFDPMNPPKTNFDWSEY